MKKIDLCGGWVQEFMSMFGNVGTLHRTVLVGIELNIELNSVSTKIRQILIIHFPTNVKLLLSNE